MSDKPAAPTTALQRLDALMCEAFDTNSAPMLDWVTVRFHLQYAERKLAEARADAERYRWLRAAEPWEYEMATKGKTLEETDTAIDAARRKP